MAFCDRNPLVTAGSLHKGPLMWKMFPCHDVILDRPLMAMRVCSAAGRPDSGAAAGMDDEDAVSRDATSAAGLQRQTVHMPRARLRQGFLLHIPLESS